MSKVRGSKASIRLINDNLKQNNMRGNVIVLCYSMVKKIPCEEAGYTGRNSWVNGGAKGERKKV
jgi:hypothetical protein